jgi:hypothetical protein
MTQEQRKNRRELMMALEFGRSMTYIERLLNQGINLDFYSAGTTPLNVAINKNNHVLLKLLLQNGADINYRFGPAGRTALLTHCIYGNIKGIEMLLSNGADPNISDNDNNTCLIEIIKRHRKNVDIIKLLLSHGANPNVTNKWGESPLLLAVDNNDEQLVRLLLDEGAIVTDNVLDVATPEMRERLIRFRQMPQRVRQARRMAHQQMGYIPQGVFGNAFPGMIGGAYALAKQRWEQRYNLRSPRKIKSVKKSVKKNVKKSIKKNVKRM